MAQQEVLLSAPFYKVYFADREDIILGKGYLIADDIERLPDIRFKIVIGGKLNHYLNDVLVVRSYFRYYTDNWGINSHTASLIGHIKLGDKFTIYPSYGYYTDYSNAVNVALSIDEFHASEYDLSAFSANQFGFGANYTGIFTKIKIFGYGIKA